MITKYLTNFQSSELTWCKCGILPMNSSTIPGLRLLHAMIAWMPDHTHSAVKTTLLFVVPSLISFIKIALEAINIAFQLST